MPPTLTSIFSACCIVPLLLCQTACSTRDDVAADPEAREQAPTASIQVKGITEVDSQTLIELPVGSARGIDTASFFRVYDPERPGVIKCMLKVKEVLSPHHSVATIIGGLFDIENPVAIGDPVRPVDDLALIGGGYAVEREVRIEQQRLDQADAETQAAFDRLRENYQRRLREIVEERDAAMVELQARHERELTTMQRDHERALAQKDLERRSDLTALRTDMLSEATGSVKQARKDSRKRILELERERDALQLQADTLLTEQSRLLERIGKLVENEAALRRQHEKALRAETETREILEGRLAQIERNLDPAQADDTTLTNDPDRNETVLERLDRITRERNLARRQGELLQGQVEQLQQQLALSKQHLDASGRELAALRARENREGDLNTRLQQVEEQLATTREHLDAASLARLESERQYYELILRVLRLPEGKSDQLAFLKDKLRSLAAGTTSEEPAR